MASGLEQRIVRLESLVQRLTLDVAQLRDLVGQLRQQQFEPGGGTTGDGGQGATAFFANHLTLAAATGTWPTITGTSTTGDVYKVNAGALVLVQAGATVWNFLPDATDNTKRQILAKNADNEYTVIGQSCT